MEQNPESAAEVVPVVETIEESADHGKVEIPNVVLPPESAAESQEIPKPEEIIQPKASGTNVQEQTPLATELEPESDEGQETGSSEHLASESTDLEGEMVEATDDLSPEASREKMKRERKERLKNFTTTRFTLSKTQVQDEVEEIKEKVEKVEEEYENEVENEKQEEPMDDVGVGFDTASNDDVEIESSDVSEQQEVYVKFQSHKMVDLFPPDGFSSPTDDADIFYKDPKYDDWDDSASMAAMSIISTRPLSPADPDSVQLKTNFLRNFDVPSLSDISEEHELTAQLSRIKSTCSLKDHGFFVDPTSNYSSSASSVQESHAELDNEQQDEEVAADDQISVMSIMSDIPEYADPPPKAVPQKKVVTLDDFDGLTHVGFDTMETVDSAIRLAHETQMAVHELLYDLIEETAKWSDNLNVDNVYRAKFDKEKLIKELLKVTDQYMYEKFTNEMVGNRLIDYFKRNRNNRVFQALSPENEKRYSARYMNALSQLDSLKERLDVAKHKHALGMNSVILDLHSAQSVASFTEQHLEDTFRRHLVRPDSEVLRRLVDRELRLMAGKRNEISDTRLFLITRKHTLGHILGKITELETLSDTLSINDFIAVQHEVFALEKKIEERSLDLKKMRTQYLMDVHLIRHKREKALALAEKFDIQKTVLKKAVDRQRMLRKKLYDVKLERNKLRQQSRDLTYQGGILAMPSLMYDFDQTMERLKEKEDTVSKLRETMKALTRRISLVEGRSV
ncbi:uncharacterized protein LOC108149102 [Drosophila elegans]|uniref:uncharacterized protein LOC108149102 n=1 Tax=Drosophila elegans TaxID=30023 RepID=UPI0007E5F635|nr:uncharacterized protein LOC108149102 [Drosophila elegans]